MHQTLYQTEIRDVFLASQHLLSIEKPEEFRNESLLLLKSLFKSEKGNFFTANVVNNMCAIDYGTVTNVGVSNKYIRLFRQYYHQLDPFLKVKINKIDHSHAVTIEQLISRRKLLGTEYYNDFLKPQGIKDQLSIRLVSNNRIIGIATVFRSLDSPTFTEADKTKAEMMAPFLAAAWDRVRSKQKNAVLEEAMESLISDLPYEGIIIMDPSLNPVYFCENAIHTFPAIRSINLPHRPFVSSLPYDLRLACEKAASVLLESKPKNKTKFKMDVFLEIKGKNITVHIRPMQCPQSPTVLLLFINPTKQAKVSIKGLKPFGISPREIDIIQLLFQGNRNCEIGKALSISQYTVENHLRSIYRKMNVNSRTALISKLVNLTQ